MPIYEYRCSSCRAELEKLQKISDPHLVECPECGKDTLVKLVSASSFRLKGSGWYETDFKTGKKKNGVGEESAVTADKPDTGNKEADSVTNKASDKISDKAASVKNDTQISSNDTKGKSESKTTAPASTPAP